MELENIVANTVYLKAREGKYFELFNISKKMKKKQKLQQMDGLLFVNVIKSISRQNCYDIWHIISF